MHPATRAIPIHNAAPVAGCGGCLHAASQGPVCRDVPGDPCAAPQLSGPADQVQRLLDALAAALGAAGASRVQALTLQPGEVELTLSVSPHCGGASLADGAFQALRALLPDTDIYVLTAH